MTIIDQGSASIHYEWLPSTNTHAEETLILIHALGMNMNSWDDTIPYFREDYHIVRYDLRGHGESDSGDEKRTTTMLRDDLISLISHLDIGSFHIVSHGLGGFPSAQFAVERWNGLKSLVLMSVPFHYPRQLGEKVTKQRKAMVKGQPTMLALGEQIMNHAFYPPTKEKKDVLLNAFQKVKPDVYFDMFNIDILESSIEYLQNIDIPILLLSGAEDPTFPSELSSASLNFNANAKHYPVPHASFMVQMDQPKVVSEWIHDFAEKNNQSLTGRDASDHYQRELTSQMYSEIRGKVLQGDGGIQSKNELQVNIMNGFSVHINGQRILEGWGRRKAKPILIYLVLQQSVTRDELCDLFWPEVDLANAQNRLRVSLHHLNQLLTINSDGTKIECLSTDREHVFLHENVTSDLFNYIDDVQEAHKLEHTEEKSKAYERLLREETENVIPGLFEDWFLNLRSWLENGWAEMALFLVDLNEKQGNNNWAIHYLQIALKYHFAEDELSERLQRLEESPHKNEHA